MNPADHLAAQITAGAIKPCRRCGSTDALWPRLRESGPHYADLLCADCGDAHAGYLPKPADEKRPARDGRRKSLVNALRAHYDPEPLFCLICLVDERYMPSGTWMEAHHILEYADEGSDHPSNLMPLCNECHAFVGWRRKTARGVGAQVGKEEAQVAEHA